MGTGKRSPVEWVKWTSPSSLVAGGMFMGFTHTILVNPSGVDLIKLLIDTGVADCICAAFKAFELHSTSAVPEANVCFIFHLLLVLAPLDLTVPQAKPIVEQLRQIPSSLKFVLDNNLDHVKCTGMTTAALCAEICAVVFGKQEDGFEFSDAQVDLLLVFTKDVFDGPLQLYFALVPHWLKPIEALCVSDANKLLLVKSSALVPLLLSALFLAADHIRNVGSDTIVCVDRDVKAAIQTDAANCFLQIAVFGPGREMLASDGAAMEALHALADGHALTPEAKLSAAGAIMAIEGRSHEPQPESMLAEHGAAGKHVMVSCE